MTIDITKEAFMKHLQFLLILVIFGLLLWSKPWDSSAATTEARTITVSGEATIEAEPDEFLFNPYIEEQGTDRDATAAVLTERVNTIVDQLKELGVAEEKITLDVNTYERWYYVDEGSEEGVAFAYIQVEVGEQELAQAVQDYLLTVDAAGQLTPQAVFSKEKRKELDAQAVEAASKDARAKAEVRAELFGAKLGDVIKVDQQDSYGFPIGFDSGLVSARAEEEGVSDASLPVLPGQNDYTQTVNVVYELQ